MSHLIFLGGKAIEQWREVARTTHAARFARLIEQADSYMDYLPPTEHPRETITYIGTAVANLALAFRLTDDARYLNRARAWINVAIHYPHWGKAHMPDHDLDAGWLAFGIGLGYDWLRDFLPSDERDALCAKLLLQGTRLYDFAVETEGQWWSSAYWQNHNWICYAGLATVGYALEREHLETRAWSNRALENFRAVLSLMPEDGSDYEGVVYWCYGIPWLLIAADLIQQQTGVDLHQSDFLRNTFYYRLYTSAPNFIDTANFGDCHDRRSAHAAAIYYRLASVYRNGHAQWLAENFERDGEWDRERREGLLRPSSASHAFLEFLWYDPSVTPVPICDLPTARVFPDLGLVTARSDWSARASFIAFKCGKPNGEKAWTRGNAMNRERGWNTIKTGHAHPDENSFIIVRGRDYLAVDEGYSQKKQSSHHNTVLVDGKGQYRENVYNVADGLAVEWGGRLEDSLVSRDIVYARGEAASAYDPALTLERFTRQMLFIGGKYVVICDDLASHEPREFTWLLQTDVPLKEELSIVISNAVRNLGVAARDFSQERLEMTLERKPSKEIARNQFESLVGASRLRVTLFEPAQFDCKNIEQEIVAYPSSSTPEWILRHTQHTLMLTPERTTATRFLVAIELDDANAHATRITPRACRSGSAIAIGDLIVAFAGDAGNIVIEDVVETDARWTIVDGK